MVGEPKKYVIYRVLYAPELACNLVSVRTVVAKGSLVNLNTGFKIQVEICVVQAQLLVGKLYQLDCEPVSTEHASVALKQHSDLDLWHQRLRHLNAQHLKEAIQKKL